MVEKSKKQGYSLSIDSFPVKRRDYKNAISYKFDNRRVTVVKEDDGFGFEFRRIDKNPDTPNVICQHIHGKMVQTRLRLSKEASEILMLTLAEMMGFSVVEKLKDK